MSSDDDLHAFHQRVQAERFVRHLRDVAETRMSQEELRLEVAEAFERNGAHRHLAAVRRARGEDAARNTSPTS